LSSVHPQELYESMLQGKVHPQKVKGLGIIHGICKERFEAKATDWRINSIGRESARREGPGAATLHLPRQEYYRALIKAWQSHAEAAYPAAKQKVISQADDWIRAIENVSSRQLVFALQGELAHAKEEARMLRKLLPSGGALEFRDAALSNGPSRLNIVVPAGAHREVRRFVDGPLQSQVKLKELGLVVSRSGNLCSLEGEVVLEKSILDLLRAVGELGS
jgi:hypothetical protein